MRSALLRIWLLAGTTLAIPYSASWQSEYAVKEAHHPPVGWRRLEDVAVPGDHVLDLSIGLKQANFAKLEEHLSKSSDPSHSQYGAHLTAEEVNTLVAPAEETLGAVHEWLSAHGIHSINRYSAAKDWITIRLPLHKVEELLDTRYSVYEHADGDRVVRTPEWSLPRYLHEHIEVVQPTNSFFRPSTGQRCHFSGHLPSRSLLLQAATFYYGGRC
jgi:tripeptidyl-peptidase-1